MEYLLIIIPTHCDNRAVYTRENKPQLILDAAYIRRELGHSYECGLRKTRNAPSYKWFEAKLAANWSNDDVISFDASFWGN